MRKTTSRASSARHWPTSSHALAPCSPPACAMPSARSPTWPSACARSSPCDEARRAPRLYRLHRSAFRTGRARAVELSPALGARAGAADDDWPAARCAARRAAAHRARAAGADLRQVRQVLSTRRDLLPEDFADELAKLQDDVPPFPAA